MVIRIDSYGILRKGGASRGFSGLGAQSLVVVGVFFGRVLQLLLLLHNGQEVLGVVLKFDRLGRILRLERPLQVLNPVVKGVGILLNLFILEVIQHLLIFLEVSKEVGLVVLILRKFPVLELRWKIALRWGFTLEVLHGITLGLLLPQYLIQSHISKGSCGLRLSSTPLLARSIALRVLRVRILGVLFVVWEINVGGVVWVIQVWQIGQIRESRVSDFEWSRWRGGIVLSGLDPLLVHVVWIEGVFYFRLFELIG